MLRCKQNGVTLIELMIGLLVGTILIAGIAVFYSNNSKINSQLLYTIRLEYEMNTAMALMKKDIRRAGYTSAATALLGTGNVNPFMVTNVSDISVPASNCILLTYDLNKNGVLPALGTAGSDDRFGYRLNNQVIQIRPASDAEFACDAANWDNLTNPRILQVTNLAFVLTEDTVPLDPADPTGQSITIRDVTIDMTARLTGDNTIQRTISSHVRVRNDKYQP